MRVGIALGAVAVMFTVSARAWQFMCDDAFISFRYAENWASHGLVVFNTVPLERVEGYTNFAWVAVLAAGSALGLPPPDLAPWLTAAASASGLWLSIVLLRAVRGQTGPMQPSDVLPAAWLAVLPEYTVWSASGLETAAANALSLAAMCLLVRSRARSAAAFAALAGLTRLDTLLPLLLFAAVWAIRARERPTRNGAVAALVFVVPLAAHMLWRHAYYGAWLPNSWAVKSHGALLRDSYGIAYLQAWVGHLHLVWLAPLAVWLRPRHALLGVPVAAVVGYGWAVGGDFMAYSRLYLSATTLLAVLAAWLFADAVASIRARCPLWWALAFAQSLPLAACVAWSVDAHARHRLDVSRGEKWIDGKWEGMVAMQRFSAVGVQAGRWMHRNLPADTLISVGAAGAVPYAAKLPVVDAYGLVDPNLARLSEAGPRSGAGVRPGHQFVAPRAYMLARDPDLLCHVGTRAPNPPPSHVRPRGFARGYAWACIDIPPIPDRFAPEGMLPASVYCCRRPLHRLTNAFSKAHDRR